MKKILSLLLLITICMMSSVTADSSTGSFIKGSYKKGDRNPEIRILQQSLKIAGTFKDSETTTYFGSITESSLKIFQKSAGLDPDGVLGPATVRKLAEKRCVPALGSPVYKLNGTYQDLPVLQAALNSEGLYNSVYGSKYDEKTKNAVLSFQKKYMLPTDGIAGKGTINKLINLNLVVSLNTTVANTNTTAPKQQIKFIGTLKATGYKVGDKNSDVAIIQQVLAKEGFIQVEGGYTQYFGPQTETGVKAFQAKYGLEADGIVGKGTINKMISLKYVSQEISTPVIARSSATVSPSKSSGKAGIPINWYDIKPLFKAKKTQLTIEDYYSGATFKVQVSYAATVHADIEPLTAADAETVRKTWGGFSWERRPVLVHFNGKIYAASMNGMPHAGLENQPEGITVSGRSGGFGRGYNFDDVKGNSLDGHFCLHFVGSKTHGSNKVDPQHQACIQIAAGN